MEVNSSERTATAIELATVVLAIDYQLEPVQDFRLNKAQSLQLHLMTLTSSLSKSGHLRVPNKAKYKTLLVKMKKKMVFISIAWHLSSLKTD